MQNTQRPLPLITHLSKPFWEACRKHRLVLQKCARCGAYQWYPKAWCVDCGSRDLKWINSNGKGRVYSFTVIRHTKANPAFSETVPFCIAAVELNDGPRMYGTIVDIPANKVMIGMLVEVCFRDITSDVTLLEFKPVSAGE